MAAPVTLEVVEAGSHGYLHYRLPGETATLCGWAAQAATDDEVDCGRCLKLAADRKMAPRPKVSTYACVTCTHSYPLQGSDTGLACRPGLFLACRPYSPNPRNYAPKTAGEETAS